MKFFSNVGAIHELPCWAVLEPPLQKQIPLNPPLIKGGMGDLNPPLSAKQHGGSAYGGQKTKGRVK
jgi:hypothetical protein